MKKLLLSAAIVAISATPTLADNNDTDEMGVSGAIVAALEISAVTDMTLPTIVKPATGGDDNTIALDCSTGGDATADGATYSDGANPGASNVAGAALDGVCGTVSTTGEAGYTFGIVADNVDNFPADTTFAPSCEATGTVGTDFACGGTLTVTDAAAAGAFTTGTFDVTVTYN